MTYLFLIYNILIAALALPKLLHYSKRVMYFMPSICEYYSTFGYFSLLCSALKDGKEQNQRDTTRDPTIIGEGIKASLLKVFHEKLCTEIRCNS